MSDTTTTPARSAPMFGRSVLPWLGITPFFLFAILFLVAPTALLLAGAFFNSEGQFTFQNLFDLARPEIINSFWLTIKISGLSALFGALFGFILAYAAVSSGLPKWIRPILMTFSGVASNFAGVPLAFAFIATLGRLGLLTTALINIFGFNIYDAGFNLLDFWGLTVTYLYFQIPLMVLIMTPAIDGLKPEWREASTILGSTKFQHWRYVILPILWPSLVGSTLLLFANAFGAVATAFALTNSSLSIVTILLFAQIRGDVFHNPGLGYALALGMVIITGASNLAYIMLRGRAERWMK